MIRIFIFVATLGAVTQVFAENCLDMDVSELCTKKEECSDAIVDYDILCRVYRRGSHKIGTTVIDRHTVSYHDASEPVILFLSSNQTVAPGEEFEIVCMAEGAPSPHIEITFSEDADFSLVASYNSVSIVKSVLQTQLVQPNAIYEDEGWYRCVAKNSQGYVYKDTYLTVAASQDLCRSTNCESPQVCEVFDGEPYCVCPYCTIEDHEQDDNLYCGSDCGVYISECSITEINCQQGRNIDVFGQGNCATFSLPQYGYQSTQTEVVSFGTEIQLMCYGLPAGQTPGPVPRITWYNELEEIVGEGEILSFTVRSNTELRCEGSHCPSSRTQRQDTVINTFTIVVEDFLTLPTSEFSTSYSTTITPTAEYPVSRESKGAALCSVIGGPYIRTFDGLWYNNEGSCTYVLSMDCQAGEWAVYARFTECGTMATCLESATIYLGRAAVQLQRGWVINNGGEKLKFKMGEMVQLGQITYIFDGEYLIFKFGDNNQIRWNGYNGLQILTETGQRTCGLCGNNNGNPDDDLQPRRTRVQAGTNYEFVESWGFTMQPLCYEHHVEISQTDEAEETCNKLFHNDAVSKCHYTVPVSDYVRACIRFHVTNPLPSLRPECNVLQSYVLACQTRGVTHMRQWRRETGCTELREMQQLTISQGCPQDNPPVDVL